MMDNFLTKLQSYDLFTLQSRIFTRLLSFTHGIKNNINSPLELKKMIDSDIPDLTTYEQK